MNCTIKEFGAEGDGKTIDTAAIQQAIDACNAAGGGKVVVDPGIYLTKTFYLKSNVELQVVAGAIIQGVENPAEYDHFAADGFVPLSGADGEPEERETECLIIASNVENIAITGAGEINGAGPAFYHTDVPEDQLFYDKPKCHRPRMLIMFECRNVKIEDVSFVNSACWTMWLMACQNVNIQRIKILGDQRMINNDGIDIDACRNVTISDSFFKTADDCLVIRAMPMLQKKGICERVTITNCVLDSFCQGIRVGCPSDNIIRDCCFSNLTINGRGNGINIDNPRRYLAPGCKGLMDLHDIIFSGITINTKCHPIRIAVEDGVKLTRLAGIVFSDIKAKGGQPIVINGCKETILEDIRFNNVSFENIGSDLFYDNCEGIRFHRVSFEETGNETVICRYCRGVKMNNVEFSTRHD